MSAPDQWMPIQTAPMDGTWFWMWDEGDAVSVRWHDEFDCFVSGWREMTFAQSYGGETRLHSPTVVSPTYWMPRISPKND